MNKSGKLLALAFTCGIALAALPAARANNNDADDNHDASVKFKKLDADNDGKISSAEYTAAKEKKHWWQFGKSSTSQENSAETFQQLDSNHDGFLSQAELASGSTIQDSRSTTNSSLSNSTSGSTTGTSGNSIDSANSNPRDPARPATTRNP